MTSYEHDPTARRMGFTGGVRWSDDVVRDNRSASWENHPSRRGDGETGVSDVSPLPRHFSVPKLGDDKPRPRFRSRRRRDDTSTTMGGETVNVHQISNYHREACVQVFMQYGKINPRLWCESDDWFAIIDPMSWESLSVSDWGRTTMLLASVRAIDGHIVGRCDEMLFRYGSDPVNHGVPYEDLRDVDPSIRTALTVHALDCRTTESYMTLAAMDLDAEGMPFWERHDGNYNIQLMVPLWGVGRMLKEARRKRRVAFEEAEQLCSDNGWLVTFLNKWEHGIL